MKETQVLIVGAGPTGLMMACQLALHNIPFIIVEKEKGPTNESRAIGIQARTLEIFQQMGIADEFVKDGYKAKGLHVISNGKTIQHIPLSGMGHGLSAFPFLLIHEQQKTERILRNFLTRHNHHILWNTEVLSFTQDSKKVITDIKTADEKVSIESSYIIGSDGAHSTVRHILGIPLTGKTYKQSLFVLDCNIKANIPEDQLSVVVSDEGFAALFPMTNNHWRVVGEIPKEYEEKDNVTFEDIEKTFAKQMNMNITLSHPYWFSMYHAHHRCVATFQKNRAFLLGDAAHIHSPIGAQGMNTGFQDAYNLAWKLAFVLKGLLKEDVLETYNTERISFAKKLVRTTDQIFSLVATRRPHAVFFREQIMPRIMHQIVRHKKSAEFAFKTVSQIGISYHNSPLSENASEGRFPKTSPVPGDRLPYLLYEENGKKKNIQNLIIPQKMKLLVFTSKKEIDDNLKNIINFYKEVLEVSEIPLNAETNILYKRFGIETTGFYLIRPDSYIAYRSSIGATKDFQTYLARFFTT